MINFIQLLVTKLVEIQAFFFISANHKTEKVLLGANEVNKKVLVGASGKESLLK